MSGHHLIHTLHLSGPVIPPSRFDDSQAHCSVNWPGGLQRRNSLGRRVGLAFVIANEVRNGHDLFGLLVLKSNDAARQQRLQPDRVFIAFGLCRKREIPRLIQNALLLEDVLSRSICELLLACLLALQKGAPY
ncbi:hypothetical protein [Comamonas sp.]|uniref:hypothetical protein n=1 Tax=Comamonas sp. TaxID=34028 RepID=UPI0025B8FD01|nr:hypothetical protein [Comamonas sp.]